MKVFTFASELWLPQPPDAIYPFFSDARNLELLTPRWLHFQVLTPEPIEMRTGTLIDYRLRLRGVPIRWRSEITAWEPPYRFIDEQRQGPYRLWRHEHTFQEKDGGTLAADHVEYAVWGGSLFNRLLVLPDLEKIFAYRRCKLGELFGGEKPTAGATPAPLQQAHP